MPLYFANLYYTSSMSRANHQKKYLLPGTYGLVVCGGQSKRMGTDKSLLIYHDKPQRYHVYEMLKSFCENVFISCNKEQAMTMKPGYNLLPDHPSYNNMGPLAALLSAFGAFPEKNILFIGCDYPFLTAVDLQQFTACCKVSRTVSFYNDKEDVYEPMLTWYPYSSAEVLKDMEKTGNYSLQRFLKTGNTLKFLPGNGRNITSIDTHEAYTEAQSRLQHERLTFF